MNTNMFENMTDEDRAIWLSIASRRKTDLMETTRKDIPVHLARSWNDHISWIMLLNYANSDLKDFSYFRNRSAEQ